MDKETKKFIAIISISLAIIVIILFWMFGFDLSGFEIRKGIILN